MKLLISSDQLPSLTLSQDDYVVFGGTFDPIHEGHLDVLSSLRKSFRTSILAPTTSNPWKETPPTDLSLRIEMIKLVLDSAGISYLSELRSEGTIIRGQGYIFSEDVIHELRNLRPGTAYWACGEDIAETVPQWKNWAAAGVQTIVFPLRMSVHATEVRRGEKACHPALRAFISAHKLYTV